MPTITSPTLNTGALTATLGTITSGTSAISQSKVSVVGQEAYVDLQMYGTAAGTECWIQGSGFDAGGGGRKMGVLSFLFTNTNATSGYCSADVHVTKITGGVSADEIAWCAWGGNGMTIFPADRSAASAPGLGIFKVNGNLHVATNLQVTSAITGLRSSNAAETNLQLTNSNAGNAASTKIQLGNSGSAYAGTIEQFGSGHATKANYLEIKSQFAAPLILGTSGADVLTLDASGGARFGKIAGSAQFTLTDGATVAVTWTNSNSQYLASPAAARTFTFASARAGDKLSITVLSSGAVVHTWPASVKWYGGAAPTTSAVGKYDTFVFYFDGTNYLGSALLNA